ncbi:MAG: 30S ribosomal protein S15 [Parcubacteria group bacterium GW2011_GWF2_38_76]|nr:MAG: 30S ribosomal protein S15 [Parcubacteria group bacterium GW2011_GWF2_38_76]HBM45535.1 30S ribosomal protein S15 [Patescibacteria group bacterium]
MLKKEKKATIIKKARKHETDTGSSEVQIALLTENINKLTGHLKSNKKDFHSRRGLLQMVADRRSHMKYLEKNNKEGFDDLVEKLNLRKTSKID